VGAQAEAALLRGEPLGAVPDQPPDGPELDGGPLPRAYDLRRVALSHSHVGFAPTGFDPATGTLHRVLAVGMGGPVAVAVRQRDTRLVVRLGRVARLAPEDEADVVAQVRRVLAVDDDLTGLTAAASACADRLPLVAAEVARGGGRLLRAPTVWEDLAGVLLSTGWSWTSARAAVTRLVDAYGPVGAGGGRAFPTPGAVACADPARLTADVRAGHRVSALVALARDVVSGRLDPEAWLARPPGAGEEGGPPPAHLAVPPPVPDDAEVRRAVLGLRGFGPWSADVVLGLLGRPRGLALDGWALARLARLLDRPALTRVQVAERYAPLGRWAGTGAWLELTADWHAPRAPGAAA
jgi:3-methyladenine DNA glycosylase/8-oxoguanine DNA glycosylase